MNIQVPIVFNPKYLDPEKDMPAYAVDGSAGMDVRADIEDKICLWPGEREIIPTGIRIAVPEGYECQVRPRSGLALKKGLTVLNSPGTIDSGFTGECRVILLNTSDGFVDVNPGERIAQFVFAPVARANLVRCESLPETARGEGGFGSTGTK